MRTSLKLILPIGAMIASTVIAVAAPARAGTLANMERERAQLIDAMLDAEADQLCGAGRYERNEGRRDTRADRSLHTKAGEVKLKVPRLRQQTFETAIIGRYRRRESSVEEALVEM